ncbi:MAG: DNA/RNA non-specific endonuclease [Candidatus Aminicenantales bacterium]
MSKTMLTDRSSIGASSRPLLPPEISDIPKADATLYWYCRLSLAEADLKHAKGAVARVQIRTDGLPDRSVTAWIVSNRVLTTSFFGDKFTVSVHLADGSVYKVRQVLTSSVAPELAFLEVETPLPSPPILATRPKEGEQVVAVGNCPDLRLAPGIVRIVSAQRLEHDCAWPAGAPGAMLMSLNSGQAVGLHLDHGQAIVSQRIREAMEELGFKPAEASPPALHAEEDDLERRPDPSDYDDRIGYIANFIGVPVPLPQPVGRFAQDVLEYGDSSGKRTNLLPYTHFSVAMSKSRRMAMFTGVNIDGNQLVELVRTGDRWYLDPRISSDAQFGEALYVNNELDRGHLVRRLDPVWGTDATVANSDTFHFTNCSPQHKNLNQDIWNDLEDYILKNAGQHNLKVSVFTGPVFGEDDPIYRDARIPLQFWKVAVIVKDDGQLSATAYILSQADMVEGLEFAYGEFRTYQIPITELEKLTSLDFGFLRNHDPKRISDDELESAADVYTRIEKPEDLVI